MPQRRLQTDRWWVIFKTRLDVLRYVIGLYLPYIQDSLPLTLLILGVDDSLMQVTALCLVGCSAGLTLPGANLFPPVTTRNISRCCWSPLGAKNPLQLRSLYASAISSFSLGS